MKERVKSGSLLLLAIIGILLIAFSLYGLFSQLWAKWNDGREEETAFSYHNDTGRNKGYAGEHRASFTNQTDVDFGTIQLEISLYKLDNPRQYGDDATIPDEPLEVHNAYVGPLAAGETVPLSFTSDTDDYNYFLFGYG